MKKQVSKMSLYDKLPEYGKQLLRSLDSTRQLDRLQCDICSDYFNFDNKKPIILCMNKICSYEHGVCEQCYKQMIKFRADNNLELQPIKCSFCKQKCLDKWEFDQSRFQLIQKLAKVTETLTQISAKSKLLTQKETEKKLKEIVERAQKDIFKTNLQSKRKSFLLTRLKKRIDSAYRQNEKIIKDVQIRQNDLIQRQNNLKAIMEDIANHQKQLEHENQKNKQLIKQLQNENDLLKKRLVEYGDLHSLQTRTRRPSHNHPRRQPPAQTFYNDDYYFTEFRFHPRRDDSFIENFNQNRSHIIELKKGRQKYFHAIGEKKIIYHSNIFNSENEDQNLLCFQVKSLNKNVTRYKFGLADQSYKEIKNANLSIHFESIDENEPLIIVFYVNLVKMKLYATSNNVRRSEDLPKGLNITKFTVFLYFVDINTQISLEN